LAADIASGADQLLLGDCWARGLPAPGLSGGGLGRGGTGVGQAVGRVESPSREL
jgi:hypothetical protein